MPERQKYRLRARSDREVIREVEPGAVYVDRDSGEECEVVGKPLPLAPSPSKLPWAGATLRTVGGPPATGGTGSGTATPQAPSTAPSGGAQAPSGGSGGGSTTTPSSGGTAPGKFNQFCQENPGAC